MPKIDAALACPFCDSQGVQGRLYQMTPSLAVLCDRDPSHKWTDIGALRALNPRRLAAQPKVETVQPNHTSLTLKLSAQTVNALKARYGEDPSASVASVLAASAEGDMLFLNESDLQRIKERTGLKPTSSSELFGHIYAMGERIAELTSELERVKRSVAVRKKGSTEGVVIDLGDQLPKAMSKAEESGQGIEEFLGSYLRMSVENDWIVANA